MPSSPQTCRIYLALRFAAGLAWLAMLAAIFSSMTNSSFFLMFAALVTGAVFTAGLAVVWLARWAVRENARPGQFSIGSLLFLTVFVAIYFGAVRWLASHLPGNPLHSYQNAVVYLPISIFCLLAALLSAPIVLGMLDVLLRLAVSSLEFPPIRRVLRLMFRHGR
jgi:hypothetical protein